MPIWNDAKAQLEFYAWLQTHLQEQRERDIRELARKYAEGTLSQQGPRQQIIYQLPQPSVAAFGTATCPPTAQMYFRHNDIILDIHPGIQGFARQMIAEMAIREQLDLGDEPGDD